MSKPKTDNAGVRLAFMNKPADRIYIFKAENGGKITIGNHAADLPDAAMRAAQIAKLYRMGVIVGEIKQMGRAA